MTHHPRPSVGRVEFHLLTTTELGEASVRRTGTDCIAATVRTTAVLTVGCLFVAALGGCGQSGADNTFGGGNSSGDSSASCVAAMLEVSPTTLTAGDPVEVHGKYFMNGCADVVEQDSSTEKSQPMKAVPLTVSDAAGTAHEFDPLDATGEIGQIDASITLPKNMKAGEATFTLGDAAPVTVSIVS